MWTLPPREACGPPNIIVASGRSRFSIGEPLQAAPYPLPVQACFHRLSDLVRCGVWISAVLCSRSAAAMVERTRSMARRWAMVIAHVAAMAGSNRAAVRHTSRRTSWVTSSDWDGSRRTLRVTPYTGPTSRSYSASNASWSPRATWTSRSSRSRSPLLSVDADFKPGCVRIARVHMTPSKQTPDRRVGIRPNF